MKKWKTNNFYLMALKAIDSQESEGDRRGRDLTDLFLRELQHYIKEREHLNININGRVRMGKSTLAIALMAIIKDYLQRYHKVKRPLKRENICRDQGEYAQLVKARPVTYKHECDVIDEWAELETTGYNSTIQQAWLKQFSDVHAGRYLHRISCSPYEVTDPNTDILLEVVTVDKTRQETYCYLRYRLGTGDHSISVLLGNVKLSVAHILDTDFYQDYLARKEQKWELITKHNIKTARELEYAGIILDTFTKIRKLAKYGALSRKYMYSVVSDEAQQQGVWFSIIGEKDIRDRVEGLIDIHESRYKLEAIYEKKQKADAPAEQLQEIDEGVAECKRMLAQQLHRLETLRIVWEEYQSIDEADDGT